MFILLTGYLSGEAVKKIKNSVIKNLVITDTIDNSEQNQKVLKTLKFYQFQAYGRSNKKNI